MSIYLQNATYIDWKTLKFGLKNIKVSSGDTGGIKFLDSIPPVISDYDTFIDCKGRFVTKSFACGHHHIYSALALGMPPPPEIPDNFQNILKYIWWQIDKNLDAEMIKYSALVTGIELVKNGVTFVIDHHSSSEAIEDSLYIIAKALDEIGISHLLCYELSDRDGNETLEKGLEETENYLKTGKQGLVGLHASFTVGNKLLKDSVSIAEKYNSGIHVHTAEDNIDGKVTLENYDKKIINRFSDAGVLNFGKTILAHCIHIDNKEREILENSPAHIAQNAESNLNNNVGFFTSEGLNEKNIFYGTDGIHNDMIRTAKFAYLYGKTKENITAESVYLRLRNVHNYLSANDFKGDDDNNLIILNYSPSTEMNENNFINHFIYGIESKHINSVIAKGKLIMNNGKVLNVDEKKIKEHSRKLSGKLWNKLYK
jgi:cytosine/adenosine deaminase-related metal-dependent hydrolase